MKFTPLLSILVLSAGLLCAADNQPPAGFTALWNGKDLSGFYGWSTRDPRDLINMTDAERADYKKQSVEGGPLVDKKTPENVNAHWKVENGELVNDGLDHYLTTDKDYGDIELLV